ncbi:hypothetical protein WDW86_19680 [Bdellovibrionota bacterium FG-2]
MPVDVEARGARAQGVEFRPSWMESGKPINNANCSYFSDRGVVEWTSAATESWLQEQVINPGVARGLRIDYENRYSTFELRTYQGLQSHELARAFFEGNTKFSYDAFEQMKNYNRERGLKRARDMAGDVARDERVKSIYRQIRPYVKPVVLIGAVWGFYFGTPAEWQVTEATKLSARWCGKTPEMSAMMGGIPFLPDCEAQSGSLSLASPVANGSFDLRTAIPAATDPFSRNERYKFSLSRGLPWSMSTGVSYGGTTSTGSGLLSKQISEHVTAVVDSLRPVGEVAAVRPSEETIKVLYGISF